MAGVVGGKDEEDMLKQMGVTSAMSQDIQARAGEAMRVVQARDLVESVENAALQARQMQETQKRMGQAMGSELDTLLGGRTELLHAASLSGASNPTLMALGLGG